MTAARRLAAILAADIVGYSRLICEDEAGTARALGQASDFDHRRLGLSARRS
jgi:class 3 adenylate cyclase